MLTSVFKKALGLIGLCSLPLLLQSATVYETQADFLSRAFSSSPPDPGVIWLSGERKATVHDLLGHDYPALRLRYWCQTPRSAWVLEEVGKEQPITVGIIVENSYIKNLKVLTYRENRGGEVANAAFTDQFHRASLDENTRLDTTIDGISGATLSVRALIRLANLALYLHGESGCNNGA